MDFTVLKRGEKIAGVAGILLILIMFIFDWFGLGIQGAPSRVGGVPTVVTGNAWESYGFTDVVLLITALAAIALALIAASDTKIGLPVAASAIVTALGILSLILVIISIISPPDFGAFDTTGLVHSRKVGVWLGLIATAALTIGGYFAMQEEGTSFAAEADRLRETAQRRPTEARPVVSPGPDREQAPVSSTPVRAEAEPVKQVYCASCGQPMQASDRYCASCGEEQAVEPPGA